MKVPKFKSQLQLMAIYVTQQNYRIWSLQNSDSIRSLEILRIVNRIMLVRGGLDERSEPGLQSSFHSLFSLLV